MHKGTTFAVCRWFRSALALALLAGAANSLAEITLPFYVKKDSWHDTMLASLEAIERLELAEAFAPFESQTIHGGDQAQHVSVRLGDAGEMFLFVTGCPDNKWGAANWADAKLIARDGYAVSLTSLTNLEVLEGRHDIDINLHSGLYEPLRIAGREFERGLHVQADSIVRVPLDGEYERFEAWIGIDSWAGTNGHVRFSVTSARTAAQKQLWVLLARDFSDAASRRQMRWEQEDRIWEMDWERDGLADVAGRYAKACYRVPPLAASAAAQARSVTDLESMRSARDLYHLSHAMAAAVQEIRAFNFGALQLAIADLGQTFGSRYPNGSDYLARLEAAEKAVAATLERIKAAKLEDYERAIELASELETLRAESLLANPLLDFDRLLVVRRAPVGDTRRSQWADRGLGEYLGLPRQSSWGISTIPVVDNWDNELAVLSPVRPKGRLDTLFKPKGRKLVTDVDLRFDAARMLVSMPDDNKRWQVYELSADGKKLRQLTPGDQPDVHCYDACYLPNGNIAFISTAVLQGVPCNAGVIVGMMYLMDGDGKNIRQVCFEQDHDYCPSVLNDGRVLYLRWDYTDTPHVWNRILMSMNPDGTGQMEYYGSNSYWPNAVFFARSIPGHPTKVAGIVTGHHEGRVGDLVIFDPAQGRHEVEGVVQQIPGYGKKVEPLIEDKLTEHNWPKFLHPYPLSDKYFLVSCKPEPDSLWGIYLVDVFDNMVLIKEEEGRVLLEPIPFRPMQRPPVIPEKTEPGRDDALVYLVDIYQGPGLKDIPRGTIKSLRLFTYHFGYQRIAGIDHRVGTDGPWEVKRVLGTVPIELDGSALFRIPAKTPISVQPLDADGKAVALMRSWMTAMPGETLSCVGCHERQGTTAPTRNTMSLSRPPSEIEPWLGAVRGFSFEREIQPVLDKYCVGCHNGAPGNDGKLIPDLRRDQGAYVVYEHGDPALKIVKGVAKEDLIGKYSGVFEPAYIELRQFVRVGGLESDLHLLPPMEFHANTTELVQLLEKGHYNARLDDAAWNRLITWIDLNAPCHGTWSETTRIPINNQPERRQLLRQLYGGTDEDGERVIQVAHNPLATIVPEPLPAVARQDIRCNSWPFDAAEAAARQAGSGKAHRVIQLGNGAQMELVRIPAGQFVMGDAQGESDEQPLAVATVDKPFWMARIEVTNEQFAQFDPKHDSRFEHRSSWIFSEAYLGWHLNQPQQPVARVSWNQAMAFCRWLSDKIGEHVTLPTEVQWEFACRAGTASPLSFGDLNTDFSKFANMADVSIKKLASEGWRPKAPDLAPRDNRFDDGALVTASVGSYLPNAWGLFDMHGNAAEWTRSTYRPYPCQPQDDLADQNDSNSPKVVRGGSWRDRPKRCRSAFRLSYPPYQRVFNVGFRVIIEEAPRTMLAHSK